jgi:hypothetical protein
MIRQQPELRGGKKTINHPNHILSITTESKKHDSRYNPPAAMENDRTTTRIKGEKKNINHPNHILSITTKESKKHDSIYYPPAANKITKT